MVIYLMIIDVTEIELTPGNNALDCLGNGSHFDKYGRLIDICCDECDYFLCCFEYVSCDNCTDSDCPRKNSVK